MYWRILNPSIAYVILWLSTSFLIELQLTTNLIGFTGETTWIVYGTCINALIIYYLFSAKKRKIKNIKYNLSHSDQDVLSKYARILFKIWLLTVIINTVYVGNFPLLSVLSGLDSGYSSLGIPSLKGLSHTLYLFVSTLYGCLFFYGKGNKKPSKVILFILIIYPIVIIARGLLIPVLLQVILCYLFRKKIQLMHIFKFVISCILFIILFGILGDIRGEYANPLAYLLDPFEDNILNYLPSGFTWIYVYITANFNNIMITHDTFTPSYSLNEVFYNLVPGAIKTIIFSQANTDFSPILTDDNLNVASVYAGYVSGYGIQGAIIGGTIILLVSNIFFSLALRSDNIAYLIVYSIIFSCIVISLFFDSFLTVSTVFQIILGLLLARSIRRARRNYKKSNS